MASTFPGAIDSFTDPLSGSALNSPSHSAQHADLNDAVEKIEAYMGLVKVVPTSVAGSGVTQSATGTITFTAASTVSVNGCFSSLYSNYKLVIVFNSGSTNALVNLRLRLSGTDASGASDYGYSLLQSASSGTWVNISYSAATSSHTVGYKETGGGSNSVVEILSPAQARKTGFNVSGQYGVVPYIGGGTHILSTAYDGFSLITASGDMTGTMTIYGYRI